MSRHPVIPVLDTITLHPFEIPDDYRDPTFQAFVDMRNAIYRELLENENDTLTAQEFHGFQRENPAIVRLRWVLRDGPKMIGRAIIDMPQDPGATQAWLTLELFQAYWGRGIGQVVMPMLYAIAASHGRTVFQVETVHPFSEEPEFTAKSGWGSVPHDHLTRFMLGQDFTLEQTYRESSLKLHPSRLSQIEKLHDEARAHSLGYDVEQWALPTPEQNLEAMAWIKSRMSTDAPAAGLEVTEEVWDAARMRHEDEVYLTGGQRMLVTVARERATGVICAFNELVARDSTPNTVHQHDTLVLSEHRGHRLGMLVKCAGIRALATHAPHAAEVVTYNAEENRPMLAINETLGFETMRHTGMWQRTVS